MDKTENHLLRILVCSLLQYHLWISLSFVNAKSNVYIVYMGENKYGDPVTTTQSHHKILSTLLGSKEEAKDSILYSYKHGFSGFAARLTKTEAEKVAELPGVVQVIPNRILKLHTTRSWEFIGLDPHSSDNLLTESKMGEGTIIGIIDTGVWPESESLSDRDIGPVPSHWKGICQKGEQFNSSNCNRKLIGARWFMKGMVDMIKRPIKTIQNKEFLSPRDAIGHGTHTASIAAGNFVEKANYKGLASGLARGGAPLAHLAIYKACWGTGCSDADILKAFDKAIHDGVDIISVSVGYDIPLFSYIDQRDSIAIGSFHAVSRGITVVSSAGNGGPISQTISNTAPWLVTVGATSIDRAFPTAITLGNNHTLWGLSIDTVKENRGFTGLTYSERIAADNADGSAEDCELGSLNATLAEGKIILCFSKSETQKIGTAAVSVHQAGGVGLIFARSRANGLDSCVLIPCIKVDYEVGTQILSYIRKASSPIAKLGFPKTVIGKWVSPKVASFSSRGPSSMSPAVLKPDIAAPGVDILAAYSPVGAKDSTIGYALQSGTSMACPHVAGIAALIKSVYRDWSPAAIRSAMVTTASQCGTDGMNIFEEGPTHKEADSFDMGGGQVNPNKAMDPGLVYNITTEDYVQFLCSMGYNNASISNLTRTPVICLENHGINLNLPSISIPNLRKTVTVTRKVTNVGHINSVYKAVVRAPYGMEMRVEPRVLRFNVTSTVISFKVSFFFSTRKNVQGDYTFGSLTWTDGEHFVRSSIAIRAVNFESYSNV